MTQNYSLVVNTDACYAEDAWISNSLVIECQSVKSSGCEGA